MRNRSGAQTATATPARPVDPRGEASMRIGYLINQYPSISVTFIRREIASLEAHGLEVRRFAIRDTGGDYPDARDREEYLKTRAILGPGRARRALGATLVVALRHPVRFVRAFRTAVRIWRNSRRSFLIHLAYLAEACVLRRWARDAAVEHVHVHFGTNGAIVAMLAHELGAPPFSVTVHGSDEFERPREVALSLQAERAAFVVAVSEYARSQVLRWAPPAAWPKVHVVRCGLDESFTREFDPPAPAGRRLTCVGRLGPEKGHRILLEAVERLTREGFELELWCLGDGPERAPLEELVRTLDLGERVRLAGWVDGDAVREAIVAGRALVLPSFAESLPVVVMEAFALARPVVATKTGGVSELVEPGVNGWLVDPGSVDQLADALRDVLSMPLPRLAELGRAGRRRVLARHHGARQTEALLTLFERYGGQAAGSVRRDGAATASTRRVADDGMPTTEHRDQRGTSASPRRREILAEERPR